MKPICSFVSLSRLLPFAFGLAASAALAAEPADSALGRCRTLPDAAARLVCYDALPLPPAPPVAPVVPVVLAPPALPQAAAKPAAPAVTALTAVPAVTVAPTPEAAFGLESRRAAVQDISSSLSGLFEGWDRNTRFTLANGQVWQVSDGSSASLYLRDPKVTVRRAAMGSFRLEIAGTNQAPRVVRVD